MPYEKRELGAKKCLLTVLLRQNFKENSRVSDLEVVADFYDHVEKKIIRYVSIK
jgi:hypothetical protein